MQNIRGSELPEDKSFDGVRNIEVLQTKTRTSSNGSLTIVDKTKNIPNTQEKSFLLWFRFKAMNALMQTKVLQKNNSQECW